MYRWNINEIKSKLLNIFKSFNYFFLWKPGLIFPSQVIDMDFGYNMREIKERGKSKHVNTRKKEKRKIKRNDMAVKSWHLTAATSSTRRVERCHVSPHECQIVKPLPLRALLQVSNILTFKDTTLSCRRFPWYLIYLP